MPYHLRVTVLCLAFLSAGCGNTARMDTSSDEAVKKSIEKMTAGMTDDEKKEFIADCMAVVFPDMMRSAFEGAFGERKEEIATRAALFQPLDGLTVAEIHAKAEQARAAFSGGTRRTDSQQREAWAADRDGVSEPEPPAEPSWEPPDKAVRQGDLQVRVTKTVIGKVPLKDITSDATSVDDLLMVTLELTNMASTKIVEYYSWSGKFISADRDFATLEDNFGNTYKRIDFGIGCRPIGAVNRSESIYPNKSVNDVLVFQIPLDNATYLDLEMPAQNYGGQGMVRFRIPMGSVSRVRE
ncbi:MAG TPA: DUF6694 family lipoprotein [Planctomycetota bacterium]|nr:DUF6694 family lipoprotein [Planctomycetota bacterium]